MAMSTTERVEERLTRRRADVEDQIRRLSVTIEEQMQGIRDKLDRDLHLNSLGELQGRGPELDRLVALREELIDIHQVMA